MVYVLELPLTSRPNLELVKRDMFGKQGRREQLQLRSSTENEIILTKLSVMKYSKVTK